MSRYILLFAIIIVAMSNAMYSKSFSDKMPLGQFQKWMSEIQINDFTLTSAESEGSKAKKNIIYTAMFNGPDGNRIIVSLGPKSDFRNGYKYARGFKVEGPYQRNQVNTVYYHDKKKSEFGSPTYIAVELDGLGASFTIYFNGAEIQPRAVMETYLDAFILDMIGGPKADWPKEIKSQYRLPGAVKVQKMESDIKGVKYEYHAYVPKNGQTIQQLAEFYEKSGTRPEFMPFRKFTLVCKNADRIEKLEEMIDGQMIKFIYYKGK